MTDKKSSFFNTDSLLKMKTIYTKIQPKLDAAAECSSLDDMLSAFQLNGERYKVIAYCMNELLFGYYKNGSFTFSKEGIDSKYLSRYLMQMRIFNENEELLLQREDSKFRARYIADADIERDGYTKTECVDSRSPLFGKPDSGSGRQDFVQLTESGRKMRMAIPAEKGSSVYLLKTRSYIVYDDKTGQAGYGFWRFVSIEPKSDINTNRKEI